MLEQVMLQQVSCDTGLTLNQSVLLVHSCECCRLLYDLFDIYQLLLVGMLVIL